MQIHGLEAGYGARMRLDQAGGMGGTLLAHPSAILLVGRLIDVLAYPFITRMTAPSSARRPGIH